MALTPGIIKQVVDPETGFHYTWHSDAPDAAEPFQDESGEWFSLAGVDEIEV